MHDDVSNTALEHVTTSVGGERRKPAQAAGDVSPERAALISELERLRLENAQLDRALESRVVIEQAKGILSERFGLTIDDAFALLRRAARSNRMNIHELAAKVISDPETPAEFGHASLHS